MEIRKVFIDRFVDRLHLDKIPREPLFLWVEGRLPVLIDDVFDGLARLGFDGFPREIAALYRARWEVELLFRELKSQYSLEKIDTGKEHIMKIQIVAALLTTSVSRAILRLLVDHAAERGEECTFPRERWATTFRSYAQLILMELADLYGYPPPNIPELLYQEAKQPSPARMALLEEVCADLYAESGA